MKRKLLLLLMMCACLCCACGERKSETTTAAASSSVTAAYTQSAVEPAQTTASIKTTAPVTSAAEPVQTVAEQQPTSVAAQSAPEQSTGVFEEPLTSAIAETTVTLTEQTTAAERESKPLDSEKTLSAPEKTAVVQSEPTSAAQGETRIESKPQSEVNTEAQTEPATEVGSEPQTEPATEVQTEPQTEPATEVQTEAQTEPATEVQTEPQTEPATEVQTEPQTEPATEVQTEPQGETAGEQPLYIIVDGTFVGAWQNDGWRSLCDTQVRYAQADQTFTLQELLLPSSYNLYGMHGLTGSTDSLQIFMGDGVSGYHDFEMELMAAYGKPVYGEDSFPRIYKLPLKLDELAAQITVPYYNASVYVELEDGSYPPIVCNNSRGLVPWEIAELQPGEADLAFLADYLAANGLADAQPAISSLLSGDIDNDGSVEKLYVCNSEDEYALYEAAEQAEEKLQDGSYALLLLVREDGSVEEVYKEIHSFEPGTGFDWTLHYYQLYCSGFYDFNGDGVGELAVSYVGWESGNASVLTQNAEGAYERCLFAAFGM